MFVNVSIQRTSILRAEGKQRAGLLSSSKHMPEARSHHLKIQAKSSQDTSFFQVIGYIVEFGPTEHKSKSTDFLIN